MRRCDLLVDGNALFAVGFFSVYNRKDPERVLQYLDRTDRPCGGIISACRRLLDLIAKRGHIPELPERLLICFDGKAKSDKGRHPKPPGYYDELTRFIRAIPVIFGGPAYIAEGAEADDAVATALKWKRPEASMVVVSTDKDLYQIIRPGLTYFCLRRKRLIDAAEFLKKIPCGSPTLLPIYLALAGDPIDGIKGASNIGPKKAAAMISALKPGIRLARAIHAIGKKLRKKQRQEYYGSVMQTVLFGDQEGTPAPTPIVIPSTRALRDAGWLPLAQEASRARAALDEATESK